MGLRIRMALAALTALLGLAALTGSAAAAADPLVVSCHKAPGAGPVSLRTDGGRTAMFEFSRSGDELAINANGTRLDCGPGSLALDQITEVRLDDDAEYSSSFWIDLRNGPLGPGAGSDDGEAEIEFDLGVIGGFNSATFKAPADQATEIRLGRTAGGSGADFNGDGDIDVRWHGVENTAVYGSPHADRIDLTGTAPGFTAPYRSYTVLVSADSGDDRILTSRFGGYDTYEGGPGEDTIAFGDATSGLKVDLARFPHSDNLEHVVGSPHADELEGDEAANRFDVRDGKRDVVSCADGADTVIADAPGVDAIAEDCEEVELDRPARSLKVLGYKAPRSIRALLRRGVGIQVLCSVDCRAKAQLSTNTRGLPRILGAGAADVPAGQPTWVMVKVNRAAAKALAAGRTAGAFKVRTSVRAQFAHTAAAQQSRLVASVR